MTKPNLIMLAVQSLSRSRSVLLRSFSTNSHGTSLGLARPRHCTKPASLRIMGATLSGESSAAAAQEQSWWSWFGLGDRSLSSKTSDATSKPSEGPPSLRELIPTYESLQDAHKTLPLSATEGKRLVIVGDVHGCADELDELLAKVKFTPDEDILIFVGDLCAKGPKSLETVRRARKENALGVRGNHDHYVVLRINDGLYPEREHTKLAKEIFSQDDLEWLKALPLTLHIEEYDTTIVHAGIKPDIPLQDNSLADMLHMRNINDEGVATSKPTEGKPWVELWKGPQHVVFGHDAVRKLQQTEFATGLDTGCVYGGALTALILPGRELVEVKAHKTHQEPGKKAN